MLHQFKSPKNVPTKYYILACEIMESFNDGSIRPRKLNNGKWLVLEVCSGKGENSWRLIQNTKSVNDTWLLVNHQEYNKKVDR